MIMTASAPAPSTSVRRDRRHQRSSSGSAFSFSDERGLGAFTPLTNLPRRSRSVVDNDDLSSSPPSRPPSRSANASPSRVKKASFTLAGSSDEDDEDDCPLVREVNQRARMTNVPDEHFGDFSFDAEAHKAKTAKLTERDEVTETEADFPLTPVGDAPPTPKLTISTNIAAVPVPFPALSPSPTRSAAPLPPLVIPDTRLTASPVVRSASSPFLSSPVQPKQENKFTPASSVSSTSPFNSGTSTPVYLKNGRPLKPSLKSRVSLSISTPDVASMLAQAKSAPTTPRVHFPTRERLESVVLFDKRARPLEVAAGDSPLASPRGYFGDDTTPGLRIRSQSSFPFPSMSPRGSPLGSTTNLQGLSAAVMAKTKLKIAVTRSAPLRPTPYPDAHVHLAAVRLLGTRMSGSVLVKNVSFSKRVAIRYTFDKWETTSEVAGMWSSPNALNDLPSHGGNTEFKPPGSEETELDVARGILVPASNGWDRFVFNIKLDDVAPYLSQRPMLLAVKFEAAGVGEWWDNCSGINYRFEFDHVPKTEPKIESPAPTMVGRPRSNTSPAPLNTESTQTDLPSAALLSAKLNSVVEQQTPTVEEPKAARPNLKLQFPSDETITPTEMSTDLGAETVAPKVAVISAPTERKVPLTLTPPDSAASSPREVLVPLPVSAPVPVPTVSLPSPAESPASRKQPSPLPSPSAIDAPAHSTTNVKDQSYADFIAKYCFAGGAPQAPSSQPPASTGFGAPPAGFGSSYGAGANTFGAAAPASNTFGTTVSGNSWGSPRPNFGWGASNSVPAQNSWGGVGFSYGRSANSFSSGDL